MWERANRGVCGGGDGGGHHLYTSRLLVEVMAIASNNHAALSVGESSRHNNGDGGHIQVSSIGVDGHPNVLGNHNQENKDVDLVDNKDRRMEDIYRGTLYEVTEIEIVNDQRVPRYQVTSLLDRQGRHLKEHQILGEWEIWRPVPRAAIVIRQGQTEGFVV